MTVQRAYDDAEQLVFSSILVGKQKGAADPAISLQVIYLRQKKTCEDTTTCTPVFITALVTIF